MSWPPRMGSESLRTISIQGAHYQLIPIADDGPGAVQRSREQRSQLQRFDSDELQNVPEFEYTQLPPSRRRIRLLKLRSGTIFGHEIFCELVDADYDDEFHIPTRVKVAGDGEKKAREGGSAPSASSEKEAGVVVETEETHEPCHLCREPRKQKGKEKKENNADEEEKREQAREAREKRRKKVEELEIKYEALSWCWGTAPPLYAIKIDCGGRTFKKKVTKELALALKYLRLPDRERILWVDAICINQRDDNEKNHQVQMMSRIYTRAEKVAIWLGDDTDDSITAIEFIKNEIMELRNFDTICSDKKYSEKWRSLMMLMQRDWFSRRWVIQEIALASDAVIYCGLDSIAWRDFAVAVELFVEVESATHRLSEIMKQDERFRHVPGWFEHISELGASLLVQATGKVFRTQRMPPIETHGTEVGKDPSLEIGPDANDTKARDNGMSDRPTTIDPLDRRSLLSLEYLVTTMFIFKATEPRDAVYALLAIARDAAPFARSTTKEGDSSMLTASVMEGFLEEKPFTVDYSRSYSDVCRDFVEFAIKRKSQWDSVQALDILCRPWALESPAGGKSVRLVTSKPIQKKEKPRVLLPKREDAGWRKLKDQHARVKVVEQDGGWQWKYAYPKPSKDWWNRTVNSIWEDDGRSLKEYKEYTETLDTLPDDGKPDGAPVWRNHPPGWDDVLWYFPPNDDNKDDKTDPETKLKTKPKPKSNETNNHAADDTIPSWVTLASQAPFSLYYHPGVHVLKTGRANADPLVGQPQDGHRNYSAAQTNPVDLNKLRFRKRQRCGHYSLYVRGFKLSEVEEVLDASQGGNIPKSWLDMAGWTDYTRDPPDSFWRTIVADRGRDNRNPPYYYATACKESVYRGGIASGRVNTADLINNERNSIVAEFCRRVQAVIWGRRLFKTSDGTLGLARDVEKGDQICILYGCTVPVILSENRLKRTNEDVDTILKREDLDDAVEALRSCVLRLEKRLERKARYRERMRECPRYQRVLQKEHREAKEKEKQRYRDAQKTGKDVEAKETTNTHLQATPASRSDERAPGETTSSWEDLGTISQDPGPSLPTPLMERSSPPEGSGSITSKNQEPSHGKHGIFSFQRLKSKTLPVKKEPHGSRRGSQPVHQEQVTGENSAKSTATAMPQDSSNASDRSDHHSPTRGDRPARHHTRSRSRDWAPYMEKPESDREVFYKFKGETYIHGMMDGQALREKFWYELKDKLFQIR